MSTTLVVDHVSATAPGRTEGNRKHTDLAVTRRRDDRHGRLRHTTTRTSIMGRRDDLRAKAYDPWMMRRALGSALLLAVAHAGCGPGADAPSDAAAEDAAALPDAPRYELSLTPALVDFGDACGDGPPASLTLRNTGTAPVGPLEIALAGADPDTFALVADDCPVTLASGASCTIEVGFVPMSGGWASARLEARAPAASASATLDGAMPNDCGAILNLSPTPERFEDVLVGETSPPHTFTLTNANDEASGTLAVSLGGLDRSEFAVTRDACSGRTMAPGGTCTIDVVFAPTRAGDFLASLLVQASPGPSVIAALLGTALAKIADIAISPMTQDFGTVLVGCPVSQVFTITSTGTLATGPLVVALSGTDASSFELVRDDCAAGLAVGASCEVDVRFSPTVAGSRVASLDVDVAGRTVAAMLTGTAVGDCRPPPVLEPSLRDFGPVAVGTRSTVTGFVLRNTGGAPTGVVTAAIAGANPSDFAIEPATSTCEGATIDPGGTCVMDVVFTPTAVGARSAVLRVQVAGGGTSTAALTGTGE
jgi:hypothetical protein